MVERFSISLVKFYLWLALGYFFLGTFTILGNYPGRFLSVIGNNLWAVIYVTVLNFILFEFVIPFILKKRKFLLYHFLLAIPLAFIFMILYSYGSYAWKRLGTLLLVYHPLKTYPSLNLQLESITAYSFGSIFLFGICRHGYNYIKLRNAEQRLRIEKQQAELNYLRSQTNPHFLFNTLNNIYSLARDKSDLAPESILRLSKILRFMLYETSGTYITIEQEIKIITDYLELEKLRYDESLQINFNCVVDDLKQAITPLLLIPLVENAFKHGASETRQQPFVDIHLSVNRQQLAFVIKNSVDSSSDKGEVKENIGLSNLRRQLELQYKDHQLLVEKNDAVFTTALKINLSSHV